jgi:hypothetical protein
MDILLGKWDQRFQHQPRVGGQVAGVTQPVAVVALSIFFRSHEAPRELMLGSESRAIQWDQVP